MKSERRKVMKSFSKVLATLVLATVALVLLVLSGCADALDSLWKDKLPLEQDQLPKEGLIITINGEDNARTIIPSTPTFESYELTFAGPGGATHAPVTITSQTRVINDLTPGSWTITANGYVRIGGNAPAVAATGSGTVNIVQSQLQSLNINISASIGGANGTFTYDVSFPDFVESGELVIYLFGTNPDNAPSNQKIDLKPASANTANGSMSLPTGYYVMTIRLEGDDGTKSMGLAEIVHIYSNIETKTPEYNFVEGDFAVHRGWDDVGNLLGFDWQAQIDKRAKITALITGGAITMYGENKNDGYASIIGFPDSNSSTLDDIKTAGQIKITVKGDGNDYRINLATSETDNNIVGWDHFGYLFHTTTSTTTITINIDDFAQAGWGTPTYFDIRNVVNMQFARSVTGTFNLTVSNIQFIPTEKISLGDFDVTPTDGEGIISWRAWSLDNDTRQAIADGSLDLLTIAFEAAKVEERGGLPGIFIVFNSGILGWSSHEMAFPWNWDRDTDQGGWINYNELLNYENAEFKHGLIYLTYDLMSNPDYENIITALADDTWCELALYAHEEWDPTNNNHPLVSEFFVNAWLSSVPSDRGRARLNINFTGFADENISLGAVNNLSQVGGRIVITVDGSYGSYAWAIDGEPVVENTTNEITIYGAGLRNGNHTVTATVVKNGVPYSKVLTFTK
jgi:hypothetical protein